MSKKRGSARSCVVLLSGGLDSATALYFARAKGFSPVCLIFDYGQKHGREIESAKKIAAGCGSPYRVVKFSLPWMGSSLLDSKLSVPGVTSHKVTCLPAGRQVTKKIPSTYVPARNTIFLSFALSFAEAVGAEAIFIGANAVDYSGYPDCRPEFFRAYEKVIKTGTRAGIEKRKIRIIAPLIKLTKAGIIRLGAKLGVPYGSTWSCYNGGAKPCGNCESCFYRAKGFREAGISDAAMRGK